MNARWNNIVRVAHEVDDAFAKGNEPESSAIMRLARGVLDLQQQLVGSTYARPTPASVRGVARGGAAGAASRVG